MSRLTVNEKSTCTVRVRFYDEDGRPVVPDTVQYRLRDLTSCRVITDWSNLTPDTEIDIVVPASSNIIHCRGDRQQENALSVQANFDSDAEFSDEIRYVIQNLRGFE